MTKTLGPMAALAPALLLAQNWAIRPPRVISQLQAEYSEEARRAGVNTIVVLSLVVGEKGTPQDIKVVRSAGFGLDEMAIRAIESWRFEPGTKQGAPYAAPTHIEMRFSLADKTRTGQTARLNFGLPTGVERPELTRGKIPANPDPPTNASMQVRFTVSPEGQPTNFQTLETNNQSWTDRALHEMAGWRFRPAMRAGQPEEVNGIFELTVGHQTPANRPSLTRRLVTISPSAPQYPSLPTPKPISPPDRAVFDSFSRRLTCKWEVGPEALSYLLDEVAGTETTFDLCGSPAWPLARLARKQQRPARQSQRVAHLPLPEVNYWANAATQLFTMV
jgi:TonB family protein